jgi:thioredoxin 1
MNRERLTIASFFILAAFIYFYFDAQKHEKELEPIKKVVIASHRPLVLHFYADWCGPCHTYEPMLRAALRPYGSTIDCQDLNIDIAKNNKLLHSCGASAIPTTVIFDRNGNQIAKETGCISTAELDKYLHTAVKYQ